MADALGLWFVEPMADEVTAICCRIGTGGSAGNRRWGGGWVFEVEKGRGEGRIVSVTRVAAVFTIYT